MFIKRNPVLRQVRYFSAVANPRVFFDIEIGGKEAGRIEFDLHMGKKTF